MQEDWTKLSTRSLRCLISNKFYVCLLLVGELSAERVLSRFLSVLSVYPATKVLRYDTQGHNHVFKVGGPVRWSRVLLPLY